LFVFKVYYKEKEFRKIYEEVLKPFIKVKIVLKI